MTSLARSVAPALAILVHATALSLGAAETMGIEPPPERQATPMVQAAALATPLAATETAKPLSPTAVAKPASKKDAALLKEAREEAKVGDPVGALDDYRAYLKSQPQDGIVAKEMSKLKASAPYNQQAGDEYDASSFRGRPRDEKVFQIMFELLTPLLVGPDISFYANRHHNFGFGYAGGGGANASAYSFHPRYRYYRARTHWDSFFEIGGEFIGGQVKDSGSGAISHSEWKALDLGYGVNVINRGNWTMEFLLSLSIGAASSTTANTSYTYTYSGPTVTSTNKTSYDTQAYPAAFPLIGWGWGLVF